MIFLTADFSFKQVLVMEHLFLSCYYNSLLLDNVFNVPPEMGQ